MQALQQQQQQQRAINPLTQVFPLSPPLTHHQQQQSPQQQQQRAVTTLHQAQPIFSLSPQQPLTPQQQQQQQQRLFAQTSPITFSTSPMSTAIKPPASHLVANSLQRHLSSPGKKARQGHLKILPSWISSHSYPSGVRTLLSHRSLDNSNILKII